MKFKVTSFDQVPTSAANAPQCFDFLVTGVPEQWIYNTSIISYRNQIPIWVHKSYLEMSLKVLLFLIIITISCIGNYFIVIVIIKFKNSRNCTNIFICSMAIADLLTTIMFAWTSCIENLFQNYVLGPFFCKTESSAKIFFLIAGVFSLTWISCDILIGIIKPFRTPMGKKRALAVLTFIWVIAFIIASPIYFWREYRTRQWCDYLEIYCKVDSRKVDVYMFILLAFLVYIPLFLMTFSYCLVIAKMKRYETKISTEENIVKIKHRRKIIMMFFIYLITSAICWSPLQVIVFHRFVAFKSVDSVKPWSEEAKFWAQVFASTNSAINPLIYGITNGSFRKAICLLYPKLSWFLRLNKQPDRTKRRINAVESPKTRESALPKSTFTLSKANKMKINTISGDKIELEKPKTRLIF